MASTMDITTMVTMDIATMVTVATTTMTTVVNYGQLRLTEVSCPWCDHAEL